ncbi:MAG: ABC transporter permease [bacterium]
MDYFIGGFINKIVLVVSILFIIVGAKPILKISIDIFRNRSKIWAIMINTFKEAIRDRILYNLLIFALIMILSSIFIGDLTIGDQLKIIKDMGLACISIFGVLIAIFVGIGLVYKEISKKTIYTIIAKPIRRYQFLIGKYLGLMLTILVNVVIMSIGLFAVLYFTQRFVSWNLLKAITFIILELMVITSFALLFSTFSTPTLSAIFTLSIFVIGHLVNDLHLWGNRTKNVSIKIITKSLYYILPNLENFNIKGKVVYGEVISYKYMSLITLYGLVYILFIFLIASWVFQQRDFK